MNHSLATSRNYDSTAKSHMSCVIPAFRLQRIKDQGYKTNPFEGTVLWCWIPEWAIHGVQHSPWPVGCPTCNLKLRLNHLQASLLAVQERTVQISAPTLELHGIYGMNYINKQVMHRSSLALYLTAGVTNLQQRGEEVVERSASIWVCLKMISQSTAWSMPI